MRFLKDTKLVKDLDITIETWSKDLKLVPLRPNLNNFLAEGINNPNQIISKTALQKLIDESSNDKLIIRSVLDGLNSVNREKLSPQGQVNLFYFLNKTQKNAWDKESIQLARNLIVSIEADI